MDKAKVESIAVKYLDSIYHIAVNYCKNAEDAADAVQNAFLKLLTADMVFNDDEHIHRWLIRVTINECKKVWRSFWHRNIGSLEALYETNENDPILLQADDGQAEVKREMAEAVLHMPPKYSTVLHLHYYDGYTVDEIADLLGLTPSNVAVRLHRGRQKLKETLRKGDYL
ncbi:MAG: sigma-70 family RNA polymerase sigma factor [Lachnospiraceae bacterium]|nr:sigma-70 family RNA polymerase sigma factor [Lachnospiraceae bacterium]